jgi:hypothetical protein
MFYASIEPIELLSYDIDIAPAVYPCLACCTLNVDHSPDISRIRSVLAG